MTYQSIDLHGRHAVVLVAGTFDTPAEAALCCEMLNELERNPERRLVPDSADGLRMLAEACGASNYAEVANANS